MGKLLKKIQKNHDLHILLRNLYGETIGFYYLKEWFAKNIGFWNGKERTKLLSKNSSEKLISEKIKSKKPFMIARYGSTEFRTLFDKNHLNALCTYSGFFPNNNKLWSKFRNEYIRSTKYMDTLAIWNYKNNFFNKIRWIKQFPNIEFLIPISAVGDENNSWIKNLKNKKILIIHPFEATIKKQYRKRKQLGILPKLKSLETIKAVQTISGNHDTRFETWFDALQFMENEITKKDFDIALIGCGAYGLPLAAHVKSIGKQAIHMGGGLQLLFGIKGKRWVDNGKVFNKYWIYPLKEDTPKYSKKIEGGCYW